MIALFAIEPEPLKAHTRNSIAGCGAERRVPFLRR